MTEKEGKSTETAEKLVVETMQEESVTNDNNKANPAQKENENKSVDFSMDGSEKFIPLDGNKEKRVSTGSKSFQRRRSSRSSFLTRMAQSFRR